MNKNILNNLFLEVLESFYNSLSKILNSLLEREENYKMINNKIYKLLFRKGLVVILVIILILSIIVFVVGYIYSLVGKLSIKVIYIFILIIE